MDENDDRGRTYYVSSEAWYWPAVRAATGDNKPEIMISSGRWEFGIREHDLGHGNTAIRVEMFNDSFDAWVDIPDLFTALREQPPSTMNDARRILDELGFRDTTPRETPENLRVLDAQSSRRDAVLSVVKDAALVEEILRALDAVETADA